MVSCGSRSPLPGRSRHLVHAAFPSRRPEQVGQPLDLVPGRVVLPQRDEELLVHEFLDLRGDQRPLGFIYSLAKCVDEPRRWDPFPAQVP